MDIPIADQLILQRESHLVQEYLCSLDCKIFQFLEASHATVDDLFKDRRIQPQGHLSSMLIRHQLCEYLKEDVAKVEEVDDDDGPVLNGAGDTSLTVTELALCGIRIDSSPISGRIRKGVGGLIPVPGGSDSWRRYCRQGIGQMGLFPVDSMISLDGVGSYGPVRLVWVWWVDDEGQLRLRVVRPYWATSKEVTEGWEYDVPHPAESVGIKDTDAEESAEDKEDLLVAIPVLVEASSEE